MYNINSFSMENDADALLMLQYIHFHLEAVESQFLEERPLTPVTPFQTPDTSSPKTNAILLLNGDLTGKTTTEISANVPVLFIPGT